MKSWKTGLIIFFAFGILAAGCETGKKLNADNSPAAASGSATSSAGSASPKTLKVRFYDDPAGFDPASIFRIENENLAFNIFSGLTSYDSMSGKIIPDLAESWYDNG